MNYAGAGLHQGGFVKLTGGETWFFLFQDREYVGRVPVLQPVTWVDGWPMVGAPGHPGYAVVTCKKPAVAAEGAACLDKLERSDHFDGQRLNLRTLYLCFAGLTVISCASIGSVLQTFNKDLSESWLAVPTFGGCWDGP